MGAEGAEAGAEGRGGRPGVKVIERPPDAPPGADGPDWHLVHECESVRVVPAEAGYRWGATRAETAEVLPVLYGDALPVPRFERAVVALAARTEVLTTTVERMEARLDHLADRLFDAASQSDLIELEARRARLAAEVSRLSVELRAELDRRLGELARAMATANHRSATVDHRGPLDLADARRVEIHLDRLAGVTTLEDYRSA